MTTQWGAPLTGAEMKLLRLAEGTAYQWKGGFAWFDAEVEENEWGCCAFRLPASHPSYTLLEKGWLDGRNVRLWFGGDKAPNDWLEGSEVLLRGGRVIPAYGIAYWGRDDDDGDIIAYIAKVDVGGISKEWCVNMALKEGDVEIGAGCEPETVTIAKMTEAEARNRFGKVMAPVRVMTELGLIKPEPTREDRFWADQPNGGAHVTDDVKAWVREALNFGCSE